MEPAESGCHTCSVEAVCRSFAESDFRDADELVSLIQIQRHGRRSQKYVPHPSVFAQILKMDAFAQPSSCSPSFSQSVS